MNRVFSKISIIFALISKNHSIVMQLLTEFFYDWMFSVTNQEIISKYLAVLFSGTCIVVASFLTFVICRKIIFAFAHRVAKRTKSDWDDIFIHNKALHGIAHLVPATLIHFSANFAGVFFPSLLSYVLKTADLYFLFTIIFIINSSLKSINEIYNKNFAFSKDRPINGIIQLTHILVYFIGFLILIAILFNKELSKLLTGLGAVAAILILVFKDAILGFVASMQISINDMVKVGDWIEMPSRGADGEVTEINLTTVKIQNWNKTISMIPTYALISETFVNWKGMQQAEGREIQRSVNLDMTSIRFCSLEMLERFSKIPLISDIVSQKKMELSKNSVLDFDQQLTNSALFKIYIERYLEKNPLINKDMTLMVRYLQSDNFGLPIQVYGFSKEKELQNFEQLQTQLFDHIIAILPEFDLRIFQSPVAIPNPR